MAIETPPIPKQEQQQGTDKGGRSGISLRAILIGLVFVAIVCYVVTFAEMVITKIQIGFLQLPPAAIGIFFFIVLVNGQLKKLSKALGLKPSELMMIYCMMIVAAMVSSRGVMEKIIPLCLVSNYYADSSNHWKDLFYPHIKKWMVAFDPTGGTQQEVTKQFFEGLRDGEHIPWGAWVMPLAAWGSLVILVVFCFLCVSAIVRRQWVDNERLSFPLVQPALELVQDESGSLFKNACFWGGVALPFVVFTINGLSAYFPSIPQIQLELFLNPFFGDAMPWKAIYWTALNLSFAAVGFFFLLPSELLFSVWFFAIFARLQGVVAAMYGMDLPRMRSYGTFEFVAYQTAGAYFVLAGYLAYVSFPHLKRVFRSAFGYEPADDSQEMMPYGFAVKGLILGFLAIMLWCYMAGMSPWIALLEFGTFILIIGMIMTRSTAEAGMLMTETTFRPTDLYRMFAPLQNLGGANLTMLAFMDVGFLRDQRGLLFTGIMDGLKITDGVNIKRRSFLLVFTIAMLAALICAGYLHIVLPYKQGAISLYQYSYADRGMPGQSFFDYEKQMTQSDKASWQAPVFFVVGILFTIFLTYMRTMFFWWPLHPLGYALCVSWTVSIFWFSALLAWIIKTLFLRYGGMKLYVKARPWFIGMIIGEFGSAVVWTVISSINNGPTPKFPWP